MQIDLNFQILLRELPGLTWIYCMVRKCCGKPTEASVDDINKATKRWKPYGVNGDADQCRYVTPQCRLNAHSAPATDFPFPVHSCVTAGWESAFVLIRCQEKCTLVKSTKTSVSRKDFIREMGISDSGSPFCSRFCAFCHQDVLQPFKTLELNSQQQVL